MNPKYEALLDDLYDLDIDEIGQEEFKTYLFNKLIELDMNKLSRTLNPDESSLAFSGSLVLNRNSKILFDDQEDYFIQKAVEFLNQNS